jgi:hypothetical protein
LEAAIQIEDFNAVTAAREHTSQQIFVADEIGARSFEFAV